MFSKGAQEITVEGKKLKILNNFFENLHLTLMNVKSVDVESSKAFVRTVSIIFLFTKEFVPI